MHRGTFQTGNNKRIAVATPDFQRFHEACFNKTESIDDYIVEDSSLKELKQLDKRGIVAPLPSRGRLRTLDSCQAAVVTKAGPVALKATVLCG